MSDGDAELEVTPRCAMMSGLELSPICVGRLYFHSMTMLAKLLCPIRMAAIQYRVEMWGILW
jgi:hypothetical protein